MSDEAVADANKNTKEEKPKVPGVDVPWTNWGPLPGELKSFSGYELDEVEDFPKNITPLEKGAWHNYLLNQKTPPLFCRDAEENRRLWQDLEIERQLDHHPAHEVHPNELPDYHFWPPIQNELHHKTKHAWSEVNIDTYRSGHDQTDLPRFHKNGVPKTPWQEQDFYVPLRSDGRFDWRANVNKNGFRGGSWVSKAGWEQRYLLLQNRIVPIFHQAGYRTLIQGPVFFRHLEIPIWIRFFRFWGGVTIERHWPIVAGYCGLLIMGTNADMSYVRMQWNNEVWNHDVTFSMRARDQGGFHGMI